MNQSLSSSCRYVVGCTPRADFCVAALFSLSHTLPCRCSLTLVVVGAASFQEDEEEEEDDEEFDDAVAEEDEDESDDYEDEDDDDEEGESWDELNRKAAEGTCALQYISISIHTLSTIDGDL